MNAPPEEQAVGHAPVMAETLVSALKPRAGGVYIDATFGGGGHSRAILRAADSCRVLALDRDPAVLPHVAKLSSEFAGRFTFLIERFSRLDEAAVRAGAIPADGVAMDLGLSSLQLDNPNRGFAFRLDGPLDMRMDGVAFPADAAHKGGVAGLLAALAAEDLEEILRLEGEEPKARTIARAIVAARDQAPIKTTRDLVRIAEAVPGAAKPAARRQRLARVFQALRRHINDEAGELEFGLMAAARVLGAGGRCVVISFHSLEDRVVKQAFTARTNSPFTPSGPVARASERERTENPRAASAKLRAAVRTTAAPPTDSSPWWREAA